MDEGELLALRFEEHRPQLRAVAYRMLGSLAEAEDAVQEAWLRLSRSEVTQVRSLGAWLTTVVGRICLNQLRSRATRREDSLELRPADPVARREDGGEPEEEALLADQVGLAMLVVLDTLAPAERVAFVLHDMFAVPFEEIAPMLERTVPTVRQLASRARRRVRGSEPRPGVDVARRRKVVDAYLAAARGGDFEALLALLDPDVVLRADRRVGPTPEPILLRGAELVAYAALASVERARRTETALVDGSVALVMAPGGRLSVVLGFTIVADRIVEIDIVAEPERLRELVVDVLDARD
ncbi:sigma-70 family RNA polymerase sigma factor [Kitasatospora sp. NPDC058965]|uniref:sigma-70 family RNA polymerase sigma factor n=1 Tax=Kitasatospora sp. NPDC058965 TaxID=3346682 RepID=UPI0036BF5B31